jgi:hypothetical protein
VTKCSTCFDILYINLELTEQDYNYVTSSFIHCCIEHFIPMIDSRRIYLESMRDKEAAQNMKLRGSRLIISKVLAESLRSM